VDYRKNNVEYLDSTVMDNTKLKENIINFEKIQKYKIPKNDYLRGDNINALKNEISPIMKLENINLNSKCKSNYFDEFDTELRNNKKEENILKNENINVLSGKDPKKNMEKMDIKQDSKLNQNIKIDNLKNQMKNDPMNLNINFNFTTETENDYENENYEKYKNIGLCTTNYNLIRFNYIFND